MNEKVLLLWKQHIIAGNDYFEKQQSLVAICHYRQAIDLAEKLLQDHHDAMVSVAAILVSHHNLADLYIREGEENIAEGLLFQVHNKLGSKLAEHCHDELQEALMWGTRRSYSELLLFQQQYPKSRLAKELKSRRLLNPYDLSKLN